MNLYKLKNLNHVLKAVNEAFHNDQKVSFRWLWTPARKGARKILTNKLLKIAMDNRLCMSSHWIVEHQSDLFSLITAKDSLEEELKIAKEVDMKDWMD